MMSALFGASCARPAHSSDLPAPRLDIRLTQESQSRQAVLANGCFWCSQAVFEEIPGVTKVVAGYSGDTKETAVYEIVCSHTTKHAEAVQITYDPSKVTYGRLLQVFFTTHDPTTLNRQGPDEGTQYRSAIFYANPEEKKIAAAYIQQLDAAKVFQKPIVTTLEPLTDFYAAEKYHQDYARLNPFQPYIQRYALPKAAKAKEKFGTPTTQP